MITKDKDFTNKEMKEFKTAIDNASPQEEVNLDEQLIILQKSLKTDAEVLDILEKVVDGAKEKFPLDTLDLDTIVNFVNIPVGIKLPDGTVYVKSLMTMIDLHSLAKSNMLSETTVH